MLLDQWIFGLTDFEVGFDRISIFGTGSVAVDQLDVPGGRPPSRCSSSSASVFAVLYLAGGGRASQHVRPAAAGAEGQPGGQRHPRDQHHAGQAGGVHAVGGHGRLRRRPVRRDSGAVARRTSPSCRACPAAAGGGGRHRHVRRAPPAGPASSSAGCPCSSTSPLVREREPGCCPARWASRSAATPTASPSPRCPRRRADAGGGPQVGWRVVGLRLADVLGAAHSPWPCWPSWPPGASPPSCLRPVGGRPSRRRRAGDDVPLEWAGIVRPFTAEESPRSTGSWASSRGGGS